ncbi:MAG: ribose-phosphate pyrophosphokinase-like domain-containing protein, partial [Elusimicrobia bacterium]|nr:ribose-phosphate pyrophosphokinase-like domain-containing protein [Elusimicrobiota bacterium]
EKKTQGLWIDRVLYMNPQLEESSKRAAEKIHAKSELVKVSMDPSRSWAVDLPGNLQGHNVTLIHSTLGGENIVKLLLTLAALRERGVNSISLINTYEGYSRQDKEFKPGETVSALTFLRLLNRLTDRHFAINVHYGVQGGPTRLKEEELFNLNGFVPLALHLFYAAVTEMTGLEPNDLSQEQKKMLGPVIEQHFRQRPLVLVSPDDGSYPYITEAMDVLQNLIKKEFGVEVAVFAAYLDKTRISATEVKMSGPLLVEERPGETVQVKPLALPGGVDLSKAWAFVLDDETAQGSTLLSATYVLVEELGLSWRRVAAGVVHGKFNRGLEPFDAGLSAEEQKTSERPAADRVDHQKRRMPPRLVIASESVPLPADIPASQVVSIKPLIAFAVKRVLGGAEKKPTTEDFGPAEDAGRAEAADEETEKRIQSLQQALATSALPSFRSINIILHQSFKDGLGDLAYVLNMGRLKDYYPSKKVRIILHTHEDLERMTILNPAIDPTREVQEVEGVEIIDLGGRWDGTVNYRSELQRVRVEEEELIGPEDVAILYAPYTDDGDLSAGRYRQGGETAGVLLYLHEFGIGLPGRPTYLGGTTVKKHLTCGLDPEDVGILPLDRDFEALLGWFQRLDEKGKQAAREALLSSLRLPEPDAQAMAHSDWGLIYTHEKTTVEHYFKALNAARGRSAEFAQRPKTIFIFADQFVREKLLSSAGSMDFQLFEYDGSETKPLHQSQSPLRVVCLRHIPKADYTRFFLLADGLPLCVTGVENLNNAVHLSAKSPGGRTFVWLSRIYQDTSALGMRVADYLPDSPERELIRNVVARLWNTESLAELMMNPGKYQASYKTFCRGILDHFNFDQKLKAAIDGGWSEYEKKRESLPKGRRPSGGGYTANFLGLQTLWEIAAKHPFRAVVALGAGFALAAAEASFPMIVFGAAVAAVIIVWTDDLRGPILGAARQGAALYQKSKASTRFQKAVVWVQIATSATVTAMSYIVAKKFLGNFGFLTIQFATSIVLLTFGGLSTLIVFSQNKTEELAGQVRRALTSRAYLGPVLLIAALDTLIGTPLYYLALKIISPSTASLAEVARPSVVFALSAFISFFLSRRNNEKAKLFKVEVSGTNIIGMLLLILGSTLLVFSNGDPLKGLVMTGVVFAFVSMAVNAVGTLIKKPISTEVHPAVFQLLRSVFNVLIFLVILFTPLRDIFDWLNRSPLPAFHAGQLGTLLTAPLLWFNGLAVFVAMALNWYSLRKLTPSAYSNISSALGPLMTAAVVFVVLGHVPTSTLSIYAYLALLVGVLFAKFKENGTRYLTLGLFPGLFLNQDDDIEHFPSALRKGAWRAKDSSETVWKGIELKTKHRVEKTAQELQKSPHSAEADGLVLRLDPQFQRPDRALLSGGELGALLHQALDALGNLPAANGPRLRQILLQRLQSKPLSLALLERSPNLMENHTKDGFIGVNRALFDAHEMGLISRSTFETILMVGLLHELGHEAFPNLSEEERTKVDVELTRLLFQKRYPMDPARQEAQRAYAFELSHIAAGKNYIAAAAAALRDGPAEGRDDETSAAEAIRALLAQMMLETKPAVDRLENQYREAEKKGRKLPVWTLGEFSTLKARWERLLALHGSFDTLYPLDELRLRLMKLRADKTAASAGVIDDPRTLLIERLLPNSIPDRAPLPQTGPLTDLLAEVKNLRLEEAGFAGRFVSASLEVSLRKLGLDECEQLVRALRELRERTQGLTEPTYDAISWLKAITGFYPMTNVGKALLGDLFLLSFAGVKDMGVYRMALSLLPGAAVEKWAPRDNTEVRDWLLKNDGRDWLSEADTGDLLRASGRLPWQGGRSAFDSHSRAILYLAAPLHTFAADVTRRETVKKGLPLGLLPFWPQEWVKKYPKSLATAETVLIFQGLLMGAVTWALHAWLGWDVNWLLAGTGLLSAAVFAMHPSVYYETDGRPTRLGWNPFRHVKERGALFALGLVMGVVFGFGAALSPVAGSLIGLATASAVHLIYNQVLVPAVAQGRLPWVKDELSEYPELYELSLEKQRHVRQVMGMHDAFVRRDFETIYSALPESHRQKADFVEYEALLNRLWSLYDALPPAKKEMLRTATLLHDIGNRSGRVWTHNVRGAEDARALLAARGHDAEFIDTVADIIERHGDFADMGVDGLPMDLLDLTPEELNLALLITAFDSFGKVSGNILSAEALDRFLSLREKLAGFEMRGDFYRQRFRWLLSPTVFKDHGRKGQAEMDRLIDEFVPTMERASFFRFWNRRARVHVFPLFQFVGEKSYRDFIKLVRFVHQAAQAMEAEGKLPEEIVIDTDPDYLAWSAADREAPFSAFHRAVAALLDVLYIDDVRTELNRNGSQEAFGIAVRREGNRLVIGPKTDGADPSLLAEALRMRIHYVGRFGRTSRLFVGGQEVDRIGGGQTNDLFPHPAGPWVVRVRKTLGLGGQEAEFEKFRWLAELGLGPAPLSQGETNGHAYLLVEKIEGKSLEEILASRRFRTEGPRSLDESEIRLVIELLEALIRNQIQIHEWTVGNIMIGRINGGPLKAYVVDAESALHRPQSRRAGMGNIYLLAIRVFNDWKSLDPEGYLGRYLDNVIQGRPATDGLAKLQKESETPPPASRLEQILEEGLARTPAPDSGPIHGFFERGIRVTEAGRFSILRTPWRRMAKPTERASFKLVTKQFDPKAFHFMTAPEKLFWEGELEGQSVALIGQKWPYARDHYLLLPQRMEGRPQRLLRRDIELAAKLLMNDTSGRLRFGYNSLAAGASINHMHLHGFTAPEAGSPLERAQTRLFFNAGSVSVRELSGYPAQGLVFESWNHADLAFVADSYVRFLQKLNIAHSVIFTPRRVYVMPVNNNTYTKFGNTWSFSEMYGYFPWTEEMGPDATESEIEAEMATVSLAPGQFREVTAAWRAALNEEISPRPPKGLLS